MRLYLVILAILLFSFSVSAIDYFRFVENYNRTAGAPNGCTAGNNTNTTDAVYATCVTDPATYTFVWWNMSSATSLGPITAVNFSTVISSANARTDDTYTIDYGFSTGGVTQCSDANIVWRNIVTSNFPGVQTWANVSNVTPVDWTNTSNLCFRFVYTPVGAPDGPLQMLIDSLYAHVYYTRESGLNVTLNAPIWDNNSQKMIQNQTFVLNATAKCVNSNGCGSTTAGIRYNATITTTPNALMQNTYGTQPWQNLSVYTGGQSNQQSCGALINGDSCTVSWTVSIDSVPNKQWIADVNFSADSVTDNNSIDVTVNVSNRPDINVSVTWPINNTENISSTRTTWFLVNYTANTSELIANVSLWTNQSGTWQRDKIINDGLVAYLQCYESSGTNVRDASPYGNNGTITGGVTFANSNRPGYGNDCSLDGTSGYASLPTSSTLNLGTNGTIEAWVNKAVWRDTTDDEVINDNIGFTTANSLYLSFHQTVGLHFRYGGTGQAGNNYINYQSSDSWAPNTWHYIAATWQAIGSTTQIKLYADGTLVNSAILTLQFTVSNPQWNVGKFLAVTDQDYFSGLIDDAAIYNRTKSGEEITNDYYNRYQSSFNYTFPSEGNYLWNVEVCDQWNLCIMRNQTKIMDNMTLNVSLVPDITLVNPVNNTLNTTQYAEQIEFNLSGEGYIWNSSMWTNQTGSWEVRRTQKDNSLIGYWQFDEGVGTTANDSSGQANTGTLNSAWNISGRYGYGVQLNGTSGNVTIPNTASLNPANITISFWAKFNSFAATQRIINKWTNTNEYTTHIIANSNLGFQATNTLGSTQQASYTISNLATGTWYHIAGTFDGSNVRLYVNGTLVDTQPLTGALQNTGTDPVSISHTSFPFNGTIDEVAIYNRALTATEVAKEYSNRVNSYWNHTFGLDTDYLWNIQLCNRRGDCKYAPNNFTLNISVVPTITLVSPTDGSTTQTSDRNIFFIFNTSSPSIIVNSSLWNNESSWSSKTKANQNMKGYWQLSEGTGTTTIDSSGNGNTGTLINGPVWNSSGRYGYGLQLNGVNQYISIPHSATLKPASQITISAWVNPSSGSLNVLREIYRKEDGTDRHLLSFQNPANCAGGGGTGGCISFGISTGGTYAELDVNIAAVDWENGWHHVVATYDGAVKAIYRDGVLIGSVAASGAIGTTGTASALIGSSSGASEFFNGNLDEVAVYNKAKTATEVQNDYLYRYGSYLNYTFATLDDFVWNAQLCNFRNACFFASANFTLHLTGNVPVTSCAAFINSSASNYKNYTDYNITISSPFNEETASSPLRVCWS